MNPITSNPPIKDDNVLINALTQKLGSPEKVTNVLSQKTKEVSLAYDLYSKFISGFKVSFDDMKKYPILNKMGKQSTSSSTSGYMSEEPTKTTAAALSDPTPHVKPVSVLEVTPDVNQALNQSAQVAQTGNDLRVITLSPVNHPFPISSGKPPMLSALPLHHKHPENIKKRDPQARIRLTVEALEALLKNPNKFQRIEFGDKRGLFVCLFICLLILIQDIFSKRQIMMTRKSIQPAISFQRL